METNATDRIYTVISHTKQRPEALSFPGETNVPNESFKLHLKHLPKYEISVFL